jgi:hypothetical protein
MFNGDRLAFVKSYHLKDNHRQQELLLNDAPALASPMSSIPQVTGWQAGFLSMLPAVQTHAMIQFRKLPAEKREEAIAETIAAACTQYQRAAAQGKLHAVRPGMLADFAVRHTRTGRHVATWISVVRQVQGWPT